jgi:hypothetical protein
MAVAEATVVTMMEVTVVMGGMPLVTMAVGVTMKAGGRIKPIKMETRHVSGMGTNGGVISLLVFMVTDSWSLSHKAGNKKIDGQDKGAVVKKSCCPEPVNL